eukprot:12020274-Alexandrium_andersonii.AAC.1
MGTCRMRRLRRAAPRGATWDPWKATGASRSATPAELASFLRLAKKRRMARSSSCWPLRAIPC